MKNEAKIIIGLITVLLLVFIVIITKNYFTYRKISIITQNPFNSVEILGQKVRLKDTVKTYEVDIDCSEIEEFEEEVVYYRLNEKYKDSIIEVDSKVFKNNELIENAKDYKKATDIIVNISVFDEEEKYEQVYHIKAKCINQVEDEDEEIEDKEDSKKSNKKDKK